MSKNEKVFDPLAPTNLTVLATYHEIPKSVNETNVQFITRTGLDLVRVSSQADDFSVIWQLYTFVLARQPHNTIAYSVRGYANRSLKYYEDSLEDMIKADGCLELFTKAIHPPKEAGAYAYETPESSTPRTIKADWKKPNTGKTEVIDAKLTFPTGSKVIIDRVDKKRLHVALWNGNKPDYDSWIDQDAACWDPVAAQTVINGTPFSEPRRSVLISPLQGNAASIRSFGQSASGGGSRIDVAPPMPGLR